MRLTPQRINDVRAMARWIITAIAAAMLIYGAFLITTRIIFFLMMWEHATLRGFLTVRYVNVPEREGMSRAVAMILIAALLLSLNRRLAQWIIRLPDETCPRCGHAPTPGGSGRCPECGLEGVRREATADE